ncbi:MAG: hypothetical protein PHT76_10645 [Anaerostipes sp.]|nr:hypothetical protein [Anaerostipes sp.]
MLDMKKSTTLYGEIRLEANASPIVYLNATISESGDVDNINYTIQDKAQYEENKEAIRTEIEEFNQAFYKLQDDITTKGV